MSTDTENLDRQRELYGEPLVDIAARIMTSLGLTQARLAEVLGLSAPMLSQLLSGRRIKIGNPAVLDRLQQLVALTAEARDISPVQLSERLSAVQQGETHTLTTRWQPTSTVKELRAAAPTEELERLAALTTSPALARLLRTAAERHG